MKKGIEVTTNIDYITGEVKESTIVKRYKGDEPNYIKLYLQDIAYLHGLPASAKDIMSELLQYVSYGTQEIILNKSVKNRIAESINISPKTVDNKLQELVRVGIIDRVAAGTFTLNPYLFGKGDWKTINELRNKNIHLKIIYDKKTNTRSIKGYQDDQDN